MVSLVIDPSIVRQLYSAQYACMKLKNHTTAQQRKTILHAVAAREITTNKEPVIFTNVKTSVVGTQLGSVVVSKLI